MLGTFHALKQNHTWALSLAYVFRDASMVSWGEVCATFDVLS